MADVNAPSDQTPTMAPPVRADDQILPHIRWVPIGKSNCYLDLEKSQSDPIYKIAVDFLKNTNFFRAFTASSDLPSIYIQQFWDMILYDNKAGCYKCQLDEQWEKEGHSDCNFKHSVHQADHPPSSEEAQRNFGMPIPGRLITANIQAAPYYQEYQENVAKHRGLLAEVPGKGKAKVSEEQVAHNLLSLQKHKKTSPADQYIFQRRVSEPTASSFHDVSPYEVLGQSDSEEESKKVVLGVKKGSQDEGQAGPDPNAQAKGQTGSVTGAQAEGQAGSNPDETSEGHAGSNPDETSEGQAGPDPVFTAMIYPNVQENLKLAVEEPVLLEEPASSSGTLSILQHLSRDFTFRDQFLCDKPSDADKSEETKVESMVNVPIQQAMSSISLMTSPIIDLTSRPESPKELSQLKATTTDTTTTTTMLPPPQAPQQSMTEAMMVKHIGELEYTMADLIQVNKTMEERLHKDGARLYILEQWTSLNRDLPEVDMKEILHQRMWETDSYKSHEVHMQLFEALEKSINRDQSKELAHDLAGAWKKKKKSRESPKTPPGSPSHQPPPPPPPAGPSGTSGALRASGSQVTPPPPPPPTSTNQNSPSTGSAGPSPAKTVATTEHQALNLRQGWWKRPTTSKPAWSIRSSDVPVLPNNWASTLASNYSPPPEDSLLAQSGDITTFIDWFCKRRGITELKPQDLEGPAYEIVKAQRQQTTTTGGPPGQVTIQSDFFFNKDLEYLRYGSKGLRPALSNSKMKATYYPDAGLEQMVPD
nr:hypothetical protein [Tanacetum cinerariifolium]